MGGKRTSTNPQKVPLLHTRYWLGLSIIYRIASPQSGAESMREYQVYCLDHEGKRVEAKEIKASSDEEAVRKAQALSGLLLCEVWRDHRLVAKLTEFSGNPRKAATGETITDALSKFS